MFWSSKIRLSSVNSFRRLVSSVDLFKFSFMNKFNSSDSELYDVSWDESFCPYYFVWLRDLTSVWLSWNMCCWSRWNFVSSLNEMIFVCNQTQSWFTTFFTFQSLAIYMKIYYNFLLHLPYFFDYCFEIVLVCHDDIDMFSHISFKFYVHNVFKNHDREKLICDLKSFRRKIIYSHVEIG